MGNRLTYTDSLHIHLHEGLRRHALARAEWKIVDDMLTTFAEEHERLLQFQERHERRIRDVRARCELREREAHVIKRARELEDEAFEERRRARVEELALARALQTAALRELEEENLHQAEKHRLIGEQVMEYELRRAHLDAAQAIREETAERMEEFFAMARVYDPYGRWDEETKLGAWWI